MLVATLEQERNKIYQQGEVAGVVKGQMVTQRQMIGQLLQFRFDLGEAEQRQLMQQVASIQALPHLDALVNTLLNKTAKLADFTEMLTKFLSDNQAQD